MIGHRLKGMSLLHTGEIAEARAHLDRAIALYDPAEHRHLATRFGQEVGAAILAWRSLDFKLRHYPVIACASERNRMRIKAFPGSSGAKAIVVHGGLRSEGRALILGYSNIMNSEAA